MDLFGAEKFCKRSGEMAPLHDYTFKKLPLADECFSSDARGTAAEEASLLLLLSRHQILSSKNDFIFRSTQSGSQSRAKPGPRVSRSFKPSLART